jgi:hypothetical protein
MLAPQACGGETGTADWRNPRSSVDKGFRSTNWQQASLPSTPELFRKRDQVRWQSTTSNGLARRTTPPIPQETMAEKGLYSFHVAPE